MKKHNAFTLIELLAVLTIISLLTALSVPVLKSLSRSGDVEKAASDFARSLELARTYARANNTYVRVAMCELPPGLGQTSPTLVILTVYSADGTTHGDMSQASDWPQLNKALILQNMVINDTLEGKIPDTRADDRPGDTNIQAKRNLAGIGELDFETCIEFSPGGEAGVLPQTVSRHITIACDRPDSDGQSGRNPFILRISGANGTINVLRKENLL